MKMFGFKLLKTMPEQRFIGYIQEPKSELGKSAKGAKYDSQGQALSGAKRVAPG